MKHYHGSTVIVNKPLVSYGRDNLDFGKGFYTTNILNPATKQKETMHDSRRYSFADEIRTNNFPSYE